MHKNRLSGQTITIVILSILLTCTVVFGGVYAYYSSASNRLTGKITMANLKITMSGNSGESGASQIFVTNGFVVPGESLQNTPLTITNHSNTSIYLAVIYSVIARDIDNDENVLDIDLSKPLIDIGNNIGWYDHHFKKELDEKTLEFRCLVSTVSIPETEEIITVIGQNKLSLNRILGDEFQSKSISLTFQAYAIASASFEGLIGSNTSMPQRASIIMDAIYSHFGTDLVI